MTCTGVPAGKCDEAVASVARSLPNTTVVSIEVSCVSGTCTPQSGAMDTVVTTADGSTLRGSTLSWSEPDAGSGEGATLPPVQPVPAPGDPALPVAPTCLGVPVQMCRTMAETAFGSVPIAAVVGIVVRCTEAPCTDQHGVGDTIVTYGDGSTQTSSWEYEGG